MSNSPVDEKSLLRMIKESVEAYTLAQNLSRNIYPIASYIINNVTILTLNVPEKAQNEVSDDKASEGDEVELELEGFEFRQIWRILNEIDRAITTETDVHTFAISSLAELKNLSIHFMLLGPLAAFAVTHGIWLLVMKFICTNSVEKSIMMVLKRVEGIFKALHRSLGKEETQSVYDLHIYISLLSSSVTKKPRDNWESMSSLYSLIKIMFEVGSLANFYIDEVYSYTPEHLKDEFESLILLSIYWILSGVFTCSFECIKLPKNEYVIQDSRELIDIHDKLSSIHERLLKLDSSGRQYKEDEKTAENYQLPSVARSEGSYKNLMTTFFQSDHLRLFRCDKRDMDLSGKSRIFVLLISDLDISFNEINFLKDTYIESKTSVLEDFELIWLPIHNSLWTTLLEGQYMGMLQLMPWYTIDHPSSIPEKTKTFIKNIWKFRRQPIIVVLNEDSRVVCPNALHLMHIWGSKAFPFTRHKERALWSAETSLSSLVLRFDSQISSKLEAGKWVILYGGSDIEWIQMFPNCVRKVSSDLGIPIELLYVGKYREVKDFTSENVPLSPDMQKTWYFWTRLESLLISRYQTFASARDIGSAMDPIIREVKKLLSYASVESWACLTTPSSDLMIHSLGDTMLQAFMRSESWKQNILTKEFPKYFKTYVDELGRQELDRACCRIVLHTDNKDTVRNLSCPDCTNSMEKKVMYRCCHKREELE